MYSHAPVSTNGSRSFAQPGSMPDVKHDTLPRAARRLERLAHPGRDVRRIDHRHDRARHDVLARREDARQILHRFAGSQIGGRGVAHAVGVEREQRVDVVGGRRRRWARGRPAPPRPCPPCRASAPTARRARGRDAVRCSATRAGPRCRCSTGSPCTSCGYDLRSSNARATRTHCPDLRICAWL